MTRLDFDLICRLCVQIFEKEKVSPIFNNETYDDKISLSEKIRYCSSVEVSVDDGLPHQICNSCLLKLNESFAFRNQCVFADVTLKRLKDFSYNVNEIPNLSHIDIKNHPELKNGMNSILSIDEFDNSKNGRHKRNIHKLKSISLEKTKTFARKLKPKTSVQKFESSESTQENLCPPTEIITMKKRKKVRKKRSETQITTDCHNGTKVKRKKTLKEMSKMYEECENDQINSDNADILKSDEAIECDNTLIASFDTELENSRSTSKRDDDDDYDDDDDDDSKCLTQKRGKKLSISKEKPSSFKCDHCHKVYPSEGGWRYHIHTVHNENYQPFICDLCGQSFKVKKNLEAHKNSIHFHLKLQLCDLCGRGFASKYSLKVHKSWHNDEKNFSCDVCGTKFRTRGKMNTHRAIHGGPKKFMCHICSRDFRWKKDFEIHMRTHTGEKPYTCSHCGKAFASLTNMKKHEKNHSKKLNLDNFSNKLDLMDLAEDEKLRRNEILDFGFGSEDVRNRQASQVSGSAVYAICK